MSRLIANPANHSNFCFFQVSKTAHRHAQDSLGWRIASRSLLMRKRAFGLEFRRESDAPAGSRQVKETAAPALPDDAR
jgi:hypothetical protein